MFVFFYEHEEDNSSFCFVQIPIQIQADGLQRKEKADLCLLWVYKL